MVRRAVFVLAWVLATLVATGVGLAAVRGVAGQVVDTPASEFLSLEVSTTGDNEAVIGAFPDTTAPPLEIGEAEGFAATSTTEVPMGSSPDETAPPRPVPPPSSTVPPSTTPPDAGGSDRTTTTLPSPPPEREMSETTYHLDGGWVRLAHDDGVVKLDAAGPAPGYTMTISANGPAQVGIAFRSSDHTSRLRAEWRDGELQVDIVEASRGR